VAARPTTAHLVAKVGTKKLTAQATLLEDSGDKAAKGAETVVKKVATGIVPKAVKDSEDGEFEEF
jgi:hypothetical protein